MSRLKEFCFEWCSVRGMGEDDNNITLESCNVGSWNAKHYEYENENFYIIDEGYNG